MEGEEDIHVLAEESKKGPTEDGMYCIVQPGLDA